MVVGYLLHSLPCSLTRWAGCSFALLGLHQLVTARDGVISISTTNASATGYSCDPAKCQLPKCNCASTNPSGGLSPSGVLQFVVFTAGNEIVSQMSVCFC
ncbi:hypothetical protein HD554DRAFT_2020552 [Boletus coccyginus]|nr:hypothetical protein HD554DRAFT_2020552 [Boletus coccyginus]